MTTITINISDDSVVDDFAKASGYSAVNPITGQANTKTAEEFIKDYFVKLISSRVGQVRSVNFSEASKAEVANQIS
jgi:hypothetical protein